MWHSLMQLQFSWHQNMSNFHLKLPLVYIPYVCFATAWICCFVFHVQEINLKIEYLETYFTILSAIERNLVEFGNVKDKLAQIVQDAKALAVMDDLSDDEVFEISTMLPNPKARGESASRSTLAAQFPPEQMPLQSRRVSMVSWQKWQYDTCVFLEIPEWPGMDIVTISWVLTDGNCPWIRRFAPG